MRAAAPERPIRVRGTEAMKALAHPARLQMMHMLRSEPASASELARRLGIRYGAARFHLGLLARAGIAVPAGERVKRGGREMLFRVPKVWVQWDPDTPLELRSGVVRAYVGEIGRLLDASAAQWRREEEEHHILAAPRLRLTPEGARAAQAVLEEALERVERLDDEHGSPYAVGLQFFRIDPDAAP
jgi:DNA-binding transcriptional ArsR family regulator